MQLFEAVPSELFSVLASPNRALYADALDVLYEVYRDNSMKISEELLYTMLRNRLERQLAEADFNGEDIDEDELRDVSGRARFLIRKLGTRGWFEKERGEDFAEYIIVPGYSSTLLEAFHQVRDDAPLRGYSFVYGTFSALTVAGTSGNAYEKMLAVYSAYDNTEALIKMLKTVYNNIKNYFQLQIDMQDVNEVLASHYDDFGQRVVEAYIRPLKIKDSVPKYRVKIQTILDEWLQDDDILLEMANAAFQDRRRDSLAACRTDLLAKIYWVKDRYDNLETDYLDEIDRQVRRYTRATTQKIENLTNRDQNVRGNLNYLLTALSRNQRAGDVTEKMQTAFELPEQSFLSERSLWYRRRPEKRQPGDSVIIEEAEPGEEAKAELAALLQSEYSRSAVEAYMSRCFGAEKVCFSKDLAPEEDHAYVMSMLVALESDSPQSFYKIEDLPGSFTSGGYTIPQLKFVRKEKRK